MITLCIRSDKPEAELYVYSGKSLLAEHKWTAHRKLADTLPNEIEHILKGLGKDIHSLERVAVYLGPGSFTGLRIGISTANALGYSLGIPVVGYEGEGWLDECLESTVSEFTPTSPHYGSEPNITKPRK